MPAQGPQETGDHIRTLRATIVQAQDMSTKVHIGDVGGGQECTFFSSFYGWGKQTCCQTQRSCCRPVDTVKGELAVKYVGQVPSQKRQKTHITMRTWSVNGLSRT